MGDKTAPVDTQEPRSQIPFGLLDESYTMVKPHINHRIWKQGQDEVQVLDLTGYIILNSHTAKHLPAFNMIFQQHVPEELPTEGQDDLPGAESPKKYVTRRFGKVTLGKDYGYHTNNHAVLIENLFGEDAIDPQHGITLTEIARFSDEAGNDRVLAKLSMKHVPWSDNLLNCMPWEFELSFAANDRPIQTEIEEIVEDEDDEE